MPREVEAVACASYTHARRHPMVLGRIAGWAPPFQLTITQVLVLLATFIALAWSWSTWAPLLPDTVALMTAAGIPMTAAWAVRHLRVEGRSLPRTALGFLALWSASTSGRAGGRTHRTARPLRTGGTRLWLSEGSR